MSVGTKNEVKLDAIKRKTYFKRVRKRWKHRDVVEIDLNHSKFLFTQYIRLCMRRFLSSNSSKQIIDELGQGDFKNIKDESFQCPMNNVTLHFQSFAPNVFSYIRHMMGMSPEEYLQIISPMEDDALYLEFLSNSKSGQNFFLTNNKQLMIKTISKQEMKFFTSILNKYLEHFQNHPHSLLVKFLGLHSIKVKFLQKPVYFIVMLSIFYPSERIQHRYDIKACQIGRFTKPETDGSNAFVILKEKNWNDNKLALGSQRDWFLKQIKIDTEFLKGIGVLDYSLLVGIQPLHEDEREGSLASVVTRAQKSSASGQSVKRKDVATSSKAIISDEPLYEDEIDYDLPGMIQPDLEDLSESLPSCVDADTGEKRPTTSIESVECNKAAGDWFDAKTKTGRLSKSSSNDFFARGNDRNVTEEEALRENRRLLPEYKNELHVIDGEDKYFLGIIDFFTRYTLKKKLENAYKRVIYPPLSFSTVHPDIFAQRFYKYWVEHTK